MSNHRRFFVAPEQIAGGVATLRGDLARQIFRVLRLGVGDRIRLLDGSGSEHSARITAVSKGEVAAAIDATTACSGEPRLRLALAVCLPKGDKLELIIQKGTELGVSSFLLVHSERSAARVADSKVGQRLARWRRIAAEAAEQCGRAKAPHVEGILRFDELAALVGGYQVALVAWENDRETPLRTVLRENGGAESVIVIVGPEGGLTEGEVALAQSAGARRLTLGKRTLRTETAAIAACAAIMYELEGEL